jgi:hypothetical protein
VHHYPKMLLTIAILMVAASISVAQEPYHSADPDVIARLSYDNSGVIQQGNVQHVCVAVSRDGEYRIVRTRDEGRTERLHGKMPKEEFSELSKLLASPEFRRLSGNHSGLIRQEAQSFAAQIPIGDRLRVDGTVESVEHDAWRLQWLNADGENPFPASVSKVVDWLQRFQPKDGKSFDYAEYPDICPAGGLRFLQPSVAGNLHP